MDRTLQKICGLLQSADNMRRCAAAIALAELAPKDEAAVKALGEALPTANAILRPYILQAFEAIHTPATAPYALPLLDAEEMETRLRAAAVVAAGGERIVPELQTRLAKAERAHKPILVDALARIHGRAAFAVLLDLLFDPDFELVKQTCDAVRRHSAEATPHERAAMHRQVTALMRTPRAAAHERVVASCLLLLGALGQPEARAVLLKYAAAKLSLYLRHHALIGLKSAPCTGSTVALARQMRASLDDADEGVVRHALDILDRLPASGADAVSWRKLLGSPHAGVRAFAVRKLGQDDHDAGNRELLRLLRHEDIEVRGIAAAALAAHKGAVKLLLDALARETDTEAAWMLAKILKPHAADIAKPARKRFAKLAGDDLAAGRPRYEPLLYLLRNSDPGAADDALLAAGLQHKRAKHWGQAVECLRRLVNTDRFNADTRFALTVCNLKQSLKDLSPATRAEDHALRGMQALLRDPACKLIERLKKETALDATDLFYVGFHFAETSGDDKAFGEELLTHVAARWPRTETGKAAKRKLKLAASTVS